MSNLLTACCCDVVPEPECAPTSCGLASSYTLSLAALYSYTGGTGGTDVADSCFAGGSVAVSFSNMVVTMPSSVCDCFGEAVPPFTGPERYRAVGYQVTAQPATTLAVTSNAGQCSYPCGNYSATSIAGTWAGSWCGTVGSLVCVNEVNQNTGLDVWYWSIGMSFESTATTTCGSLSRPTWRAWVGLTSEMQSSCHGPSGLTWTGLSTGVLPSYPRWHDGRRRSLIIEHRPDTASFPFCDCLYAQSVLLGNPIQTESLSVGIT